MDPTIEKVFILIGMFIATLLFSMIPFKLVGVDTKWKKIVSLCSCFSGGVFLAACLLDLFPDIDEAPLLPLVRFAHSCHIFIMTSQTRVNISYTTGITLYYISNST